MNEDESRIYAGLCEVTYEGEPFDLGHGIVLRSTYAHLFAAPMMAFARAPEGRHHPSPWRAAQGGFSHDIEAELSVPASGNLPAGLTGEDTAQLLASLLRLAGYPYLTIPVISDHAFDAAATAKEEPILRPLEIDRRIISAASPDITKLKHSVLDWVRSVWPATAALMKENRKFRNALWAVDACTIAGHSDIC